MKKMIKELLPKNVIDTLLKFKLINEFRLDYGKYKNNAMMENTPSGYKQLIGIIIFKTHAIEKGLSHTNFKSEFGKTSIFTHLHDYLVEYNKRKYNLEDEFYQAAISALNEYKKKHESLGIDIPWFDQLFEQMIIQPNETSGTKRVLANEYEQNVDFKNLAENRVSIREFGNESVHLSDIMEAVSISRKTPSVCNRQPWRVKIIQDPRLIEKALQIQDGLAGYKMPDKLLLVTVDVSYFNGMHERNEPYIDGGLFTMSLLYALEYKNIAAVALNAMFTHKKTNEIVKLLDLPQGEVLITFIAVGQYPDEVLVPKSFRGSVDTIVKTY